MSLRRAFAQPARYAALLSGALPVLAFPAANAEALAWVGLVPGLLLFRASHSAREAAVRGWWFGTGFMLGAHYWLAPNLGPGLLLAAVAFGVLWTGVSVSAWLLLRPPVTSTRTLAAVLVVPSYWLVIEWVRSWQWFGGPWALLGASQWQHPAVLALASIGGVWLVSFVIVAANTALAAAVAAPRRAVRLAGLAVTVAAVAAGPAAYALRDPPPAGEAVTVALVQPGLIHNPAARLRASERLSHGLASRRPDLIVWGESSVGYDLRRSPVLLRQIEADSAADAAPILVNQDSLAPGGKSKTALLVGRDGVEGSYTKTRLVPFGEYIPFRGELGWLATISRAAPVNMRPGHGARVLTVAGDGRRIPVGVLICFESAFPDMSRADAQHGARLIVYQTSDATFQQSWAPAQHASLGAVRAAETGRPVVQAALTGDSAAFDASGRLLAWLPAPRRGVVIARLHAPPPGYRTTFDRIGEVVPWTAVGIAVGAAILGIFLRRRPHRSTGILLDGNYRPAPCVFITEHSPGPTPAPPGHDPDRGGA